VALEIQDIAWHRTVGRLIDQLDKPVFWPPCWGCWPIMWRLTAGWCCCFSRSPPQVLAEQAMADGGVDTLFQDYLQGLYRLDPFYVASLEYRHAGLLRLDEVAPDRFPFTDYYQRYFRLNIVEDEVQFNLPGEDGSTLCLSLGAGQRFSPEQMATLSLLQPWVLALMRQRLHFEQLAASKPAVAARRQPRLGWKGRASPCARTRWRS
jgi:hypothetical protein